MALAHGTASSYRHGCRCEACREAHRDWTRGYRARLAAKLKTNPNATAHGYDITYTDWGCRCRPCLDAHRAKQRRERAKAAAS